ncbi:uncharacterized protein [Periplaneta americana]|uniref:uncharacterized protein n=1 Tax=Periplaneta americana TaxID=6978 RepID=UPI0037E7BFA0
MSGYRCCTIQQMKDDILDSPKTRTCSTQRSPRRKPGIGSVDVTTPHPDLTTCGTEPDADSTSGAVSSPPYSTESIVSTTDAADWKRPTTILLHKKGPEEDISNWRPIASQTRRASSMRRASQQGSRSSAVGTTGSPQSRRASCPMRSVLSTTLLQTAIQNARRNRAEIAVAWLDLQNAFCSVPHSTIWD